MKALLVIAFAFNTGAGPGGAPTVTELSDANTCPAAIEQVVETYGMKPYLVKETKDYVESRVDGGALSSRMAKITVTCKPLQ